MYVSHYNDYMMQCWHDLVSLMLYKLSYSAIVIATVILIIVIIIITLFLSLFKVPLLFS